MDREEQDKDRRDKEKDEELNNRNYIEMMVAMHAQCRTMVALPFTACRSMGWRIRKAVRDFGKVDEQAIHGPSTYWKGATKDWAVISDYDSSAAPPFWH